MGTSGVVYELKKALAVYAALVQLLAGAVERIEIAGSARRERALVHDLDVVIVASYKRIGPVGLFDLENKPVSYEPSDLQLALKGLAEVKPNSKVARFLFQEMPVELYLAERDGSNFEALLQMRTGSAAFNITLATRAKQLGAEYRAGYGIYQAGRRLDDGTERGIFDALRLPYLRPERRG